VSAYKVARLDDIEEVDDGRCPWRGVRHHLGIAAFGVNAWTAQNAGDRIINEHAEEDGEEELYVVLNGRATFELDDEKVDAPEGTLVFAKPGVRRTAFAEEAATTILAIGGEVGRPYEAFGWEVWMPLNALYQAGDYEGAIEQGREVIAANPQYVGPLYNLACCESLAGHKEDAIEHLRLAIERSTRFRDFARDDSDFDPIRDEPAFKKLLEAPA
jgi:mannose-6-phosphate isomerase-like protein (cupin superfamily)